MPEKKLTDQRLTDKRLHDRHEDGCTCWCSTPYSVCPRRLSEGTSCRAKPVSGSLRSSGTGRPSLGASYSSPRLGEAGVLEDRSHEDIPVGAIHAVTGSVERQQPRAGHLVG